jgi:hypothetical protein
MRYTTDLTDTEWKLIEEIFETKKEKNFQKHNKRELVNAVLYCNKRGVNGVCCPKISQVITLFGHFIGGSLSVGGGKSDG